MRLAAFIEIEPLWGLASGMLSRFGADCTQGLHSKPNIAKRGFPVLFWYNPCCSCVLGELNGFGLRRLARELCQMSYTIKTQGKHGPKSGTSLETSGN